jgi:hypothetical protein
MCLIIPFYIHFLLIKDDDIPFLFGVSSPTGSRPCLRQVRHLTVPHWEPSSVGSRHLQYRTQSYQCQKGGGEGNRKPLLLLHWELLNVSSNIGLFLRNTNNLLMLENMRVYLSISHRFI